MRIGAYKYFKDGKGLIVRIHVNNDALEVLEDILEPANKTEIANSIFEKDLESITNDS